MMALSATLADESRKYWYLILVRTRGAKGKAWIPLEIVPLVLVSLVFLPTFLSFVAIRY